MNELKLLKGDSQELKNGLRIYPLTLGEIADLGEQKYNQYLSVISINKDLLINALSSPDFSNDEIGEINNLSNLECIIFGECKIQQ
ncbi:hypothetical protein M5V91_10880 [Cytobacillus pseudoceanisediminis]|uniref:hypothetical protein n=1 Tax=Cytobacillus pseudoceanisediminis TaxID=3051614 RepID=UPI00218882B1|nr:hypothetical protein [Cytobacillus pseudoceanisediminis]UQX56082.1 hypothetical protein M5V91_10880 [Cytobacillus pseudoceanisediminis]